MLNEFAIQVNALINGEFLTHAEFVEINRFNFQQIFGRLYC